MKKKMYSPMQITMGTILGGPLAAMYFLKSNFDALLKFDESKRTIIISILVSIALIAVIPFLPKKFPNTIIPILYLTPALWINKKHQLTKESILKSEEYGLQSNWKVLWLSILWLLAFFIPALVILFILNSIGIIKIA